MAVCNYLFVLLNPLTSSPVSSIPLVPNIFGTRDQFHGRQFFHALGCGGGGQEAELWPGREVGDRRQSSAFKAALFMDWEKRLGTPSPHHPSIWQPSKCSSYPWFFLCSFCLLTFFLHSTVDRYVLIAILLLIVLIFFFFLNKSL